MRQKLELYCVTNVKVPHLECIPINIGCVSIGDFPPSYIQCNNGKNIFTIHYFNGFFFYNLSNIY